MAIETKHFYWLPTPTVWQDAERWRLRRQAIAREFSDASDLVNANLANAASDQIAGMAKLAVNAAVARIKTASKAKFDQSAAIKLDKIA